MNQHRTTPENLTAQRLALRLQLQRQRMQIAERIERRRTSDSTFPRSITMRFLLRRPEQVAALLAELTTLVMGARLLKAITAALFVSRFLLAAHTHHSPSALPTPPLSDQSRDC